MKNKSAPFNPFTFEDMPDHEAALLSVKAVKDLLNDLNISYKLGDYGADAVHFEGIAKAALSAGQLISNIFEAFR